MDDRPLVPVALALGANVGDCVEAMRRALKALATYVDIDAVSSVFESAPVYVTDQPAFLNAVLIGKTRLDPLALLWTIKDIESDLGRSPSYRYGPREIDIDIVLYGQLVLETTELTIPHVHMHERDFVLLPLREIAAEWVNPKQGKTVAELSAALPESALKCLGPLLVV